jgi:hypothetical protein
VPFGLCLLLRLMAATGYSCLRFAPRFDWLLFDRRRQVV